MRKIFKLHLIRKIKTKQKIEYVSTITLDLIELNIVIALPYSVLTLVCVCFILALPFWFVKLTFSEFSINTIKGPF